jgi:hypothetical protein
MVDVLAAGYKIFGSPALTAVKENDSENGGMEANGFVLICR